MPDQSATGEPFVNALFENQMVEGDYYISSNAWTIKFELKVNKLNDVSLLKYSWISCKRELNYDLFAGLINCPLLLAFDYP